MGVCNNHHFAIAHPLHPLHPWGWGLQGVSSFLHPWAGGSHAFKPTKLLKVITFDHLYKRNHYSFEHSSFYILAFIQSPWGLDQHLSNIWHPRTCLGTLREKIRFLGQLACVQQLSLCHCSPPAPPAPLGLGAAGGELFSASLGRGQPCF